MTRLPPGDEATLEQLRKIKLRCQAAAYLVQAGCRKQVAFACVGILDQIQEAEADYARTMGEIAKEFANFPLD